MHPKQSSDTLRPVLPRFLYFIGPLILSFSRGGASAKGQFDGMVAHVARPAADEFTEPLAVTREQRTRGLLEVRQVAGHRRHEVIGCLLPLAALIHLLVRAPGGLHQFANRDGSTAG